MPFVLQEWSNGARNLCTISLENTRAVLVYGVFVLVI